MSQRPRQRLRGLSGQVLAVCVVDELMLEIGSLMIQKQRAEKREWIGLTDEEIGWLWHYSPSNSHDYARAIEAKLKEKNFE